MVCNFLNNARDNQFQKIRIITGKGLNSNSGKGVLKELTESILRKQSLNFQDAKISEGGSGAINININ